MRKIYIDSDFKCHISELDAAQREYEKQLITTYGTALKKVGVVV